MKTYHKIILDDARAMAAVPDRSVALVVTSPPYPMIEMWDDIFAARDPSIRDTLERADGPSAFESMHRILDRVWRELRRVLAPGGIACINIGDATRTLGSRFALYPNHARILSSLQKLGFTPLPAILWRKQTNAPNKFMGSGMLPPGAYVTLEHEYVLVVRKGDRREFRTAASKTRRRESAFFWEERNRWFSDVWFDLKGARQALGDRKTRDRNGAFPLELPYRLVSMFSVKGDTVLDPFLGTGTTALAAMATGRNSIGYEIDSGLVPAMASGVQRVEAVANARIEARLDAHAEFIRSRHETRGKFGYRNEHYGFPVVTRQETGLLLNRVESVRTVAGTDFLVEYAGRPRSVDVDAWSWFFEGVANEGSGRIARRARRPRRELLQLDLLEPAD